VLAEAYALVKVIAAHIQTHSVNLAFGPKSGFKKMSVSDRFRASKWDPFTTLLWVYRYRPIGCI